MPSYDPLGGWNGPNGPATLIFDLLEDFLAFGVAVLNKNTEADGAPPFQYVSLATPPDDLNTIVAYSGDILAYPDFLRADKKGCSISLKTPLHLRWTRCIASPETAGQIPTPAEMEADAKLMLTDRYLMAMGYLKAWLGNTLFERYSLQCESLTWQRLKAIPMAGRGVGAELIAEVQLNGLAVRPPG